MIPFIEHFEIKKIIEMEDRLMMSRSKRWGLGGGSGRERGGYNLVT